MIAPRTAGLRRLLRLAAIYLFSLALCGAAAASPRPSSSRPIAVVKALYAAFDRGDLKSVLDLVSNDVVWVQYGPSHLLPFAGVFHGRPGVENFFKLVDQNLEDVHAGQREYILSGDRVIVPGWEDSVVRTTGGHYRVHNVHIFTVAHGQITRFEEYIDNADIAEAFQPASIERGEALFTTCAGCHGDSGQGRPAMHAPNLTGLGNAYLLTQLRNFRSGIRGNPSDTYGFMMIGRSQALPGDRGLRDVAAYVASLPVRRSLPDLSGSAKHGMPLYETHCAACHGAHAEGNSSLGAPPLRQQDGTYLWTQLGHFRSGVRGSNPADVRGKQMAAAVKQMRPQALKDILAFASSQ